MAKRLLILNGLAILGVILNHSASWGFISMFWWTDRYFPVAVPNFDQMGSIAYFSLRVIEQLIAFSVPAFLFVSGFFIAFAVGREGPRAGYKVAGTRITVLLIPYLIWSAVMFLYYYSMGRSYSVIEYLEMLVKGEAADPYYYIPLVIQLLLLAPIFLMLVKKQWKLTLLIVAIIQLGIQSLRYPYFLGVEQPLINQLVKMTPGWFFPSKMFWFVFGIVISLHLTEFKQWIIKYRRGFLVALIILLTLGIVEWEAILQLSVKDWVGYYDTSLDSLYAFTFIICFLAFEQFTIPYSRKVLDLGGKSYGIYLVHALVLIIVAKIVYHVIPTALAHQILFQPILIITGLGIPLLLMALLKKSPANRFYRYIFG